MIEKEGQRANRGFFCYPAMVRDPWIDSMRARGEFTALLQQARLLQREAATAFASGGGETLLGLGPDI